MILSREVDWVTVCFARCHASTGEGGDWRSLGKNGGRDGVDESSNEMVLADSDQIFKKGLLQKARWKLVENVVQRAGLH